MDACSGIAIRTAELAGLRYARRMFACPRRPAAWIVVAALLSCVARVGFAAEPAALAARLRALAGDGASDCGTAASTADRNALACANGALASGARFRIALPLADGMSWQGAARDAQGRLWAVFYDAGEAGSGPTLSALLCRTLSIASERGETTLDCAPTLDVH